MAVGNVEKLIRIFIKDGRNWQFNPVTDFIITRREIIKYFVLPGVSQFVSKEYHILNIFNEETTWN